MTHAPTRCASLDATHDAISNNGPVFFVPEQAETRRLRPSGPVLQTEEDGSDDDGHGHPINDDPEL